PRITWIAVATSITVWLATAAPDRAWLAAAAALPILLLLRRASPATWSLPALAPVLGLATVVGAFPAVAGRAANDLWTRAALGALGAWLTLLAEPVLHRTLLLGAPDNDGGAHALQAIATAPAIALVGLWAVAAAVLPLLVRGRILAVDLVAATGWAAALAAASQAAIGAAPRGLVVGAVAAGVLAVVPRSSPEPRDAR
ncbi:MAG TPA: hypothetical protein VI318_24680, partial [Baekduia sp.]